MPITLLDGILVGFTLVSAMLAMVRGFSREILSIVSWAAAAAAAFFFYKPVLPYVQPYIDNEQDRHGGGRRRRLPHRADRRLGHHHEARRLDHRFQDRRARPHARLPLRRGARHPGRRGRRCCSSTGWPAPRRPPGSPTPSRGRCSRPIGAKLESLLPEDPENAILKKLNPNQPAAETPPAADAPAADAPAAGDDRRRRPTTRPTLRPTTRRRPAPAPTPRRQTDADGWRRTGAIRQPVTMV